ncbi:peptidase [bacterium]|nr:peptidase [bacterium]
MFKVPFIFCKRPKSSKNKGRHRNGQTGLYYFSDGMCYLDRRLPEASWCYVTSSGEMFINTAHAGTAAEWEYVIAHCLLHLGLGHLRQERLGDPLWQRACDLAVTIFLRGSKIGQAPIEFSDDMPVSASSAEQAYDRLNSLSPERRGVSFSTMGAGQFDMVWDAKPRRDYERELAISFMEAMRRSVAEAAKTTADGNRVLQEHYVGNCPDACRHAREWFISSYPLLGAVAADFKIIADAMIVQREKIPIAAVSPQLREIYVNPYANLSDSEWKFVLAHEFLHASLRHDVRCEDRDPLLWNVACDYVINSWLLEMRIGDMPEGVLFDEQLRQKTAEAIYDEISEKIRYYRRLAPKDLVYGERGWWNSADGADLDAFYRSALQNGLQYHQDSGRGYLPSGLVEEIYALNRPPIRWDVELARWFDEQFEPIEKQRTYARLSRRQSASPNVPRPGRRWEEQLAEQRIFAVLLDTSGSMNRELLAAALGTVASYSAARDVHRVRVIFCDAAPYDQGIMRPEDLAGAVKVLGRGGTVLQPGIDILDRDRDFPKEAPLLIITDGWCDRLNLSGRPHAYLIPSDANLPFPPKGPVFRLKKA